MASVGIDYGMGLTNIDHETGIRFGVIHAHDLGQSWYDSSEADYGHAHCPDCGQPAKDSGEASQRVKARKWFDGKDYYCLACKQCFWSDSAFPDSPLSHNLNDGEYTATQGGDDSDVFVTKSPYFTFAPFCSPCAPGAGYLRDAGDSEADGVKTYCFGHDWFEDGKAPYAVYRVSDGSVVEPGK